MAVATRQNRSPNPTTSKGYFWAKAFADAKRISGEYFGGCCFIRRLENPQRIRTK
jgi:hypothetical protein